MGVSTLTWGQQRPPAQPAAGGAALETCPSRQENEVLRTVRGGRIPDMSRKSLPKQEGISLKTAKGISLKESSQLNQISVCFVS